MNRFHVRSVAHHSHGLMRWAAVISTASIALMSCGGDDDSSATRAVFDEQVGAADAPDEIAPAETAAPAAEATSESTVDGGATQNSGDGGAAAPPERLLIMEVTVGVEVPDVDSAVSDLISIGSRFDAQVYGSDVQLADTEHSTGSLTFRLPRENVDSMITEVKALGRQVSRLQDTDDVTDRVTDVNTRIATAQQSVERVQRLLVEAQNLGEVVLLEGELTARQTVLEGLLAEQRNLGHRTALATLTIDLETMPPDALVVEPVTDTHEGDSVGDGVGDAFAEGGRAFVTAIGAVLILVGYTAPFLAVALVVGLIVWMVSRRRAQRNRSVAPLRPPAPDEGQRTSEPDSAGASRS